MIAELLSAMHWPEPGNSDSTFRVRHRLGAGRSRPYARNGFARWIPALACVLLGISVLGLWAALAAAHARIAGLEQDLQQAGEGIAIQQRLAQKINAPVPPGEVRAWVTHERRPGRPEPVAGARARIVPVADFVGEPPGLDNLPPEWFGMASGFAEAPGPVAGHLGISDIDGFLRFENLAPGDYMLFVAANNPLTTEKLVWRMPVAIDPHPSLALVLSAANVTTLKFELEPEQLLLRTDDNP